MNLKDLDLQGTHMGATRTRSPQEERQHLLDILDVLHINIDAFKQGRSAGWMSVSAQLFVLLCDRSKYNRQTALVERVMPGFCLLPLREDLSDKVGRYLFFLPRIKFNHESLSLELFAFDEPKIPLGDWLSQVIAIGTVNESGVPISIETLITDTRNQAGGGHFDSNVREELQAAESFTFVEGGARLPFFAKTLVAIGEHVQSEVRNQLRAAEAHCRRGGSR